jgi:hypothetical protein
MGVGDSSGPVDSWVDRDVGDPKLLDLLIFVNSMEDTVNED